MKTQPVKAIVFHGPDDIRIGDFALGECGPDDIEIRTLYTMVSTGSELRALTGFYQNKAPFPLIPGYSVVGEVTRVGERATGFRVGDLVSSRAHNRLEGASACWGGQASAHISSTLGSGRPVLLPAGADPLDYAIVETSAISLRGVEGAAPRPGETAVVIGQGIIGAYSAAWLQARGCRVVVTDIDKNRLDRARARGVSAAVSAADEHAESRLQAFLYGGGADIVIESSGSTRGVLLAYRLLRKKPQSHGDPMHYYGGNWPRLVMQATYREPVTLDPFKFVPGEGITIIAPKDRGVEDRQKTVEAIRGGQINSRHFIDSPVDFCDAVQAYRNLRDNPSAHFSLVFDWTRA